MELTKSRLSVRLCRIFCLVLTLVLAYRWQRIFFLMCTDGILSDMPNHIKLALGHNDYGLSSYIIRFLWSLGDEHFAQTALSLVLAANHVVGLFTLWLLLCELFPQLNKVYAFLAVLLAHLCGPWILPGVQSKMYLGVYNGNVYHNMTVLFSRTFIPLCLLFFFRCWDQRHGTLPRGAWLGLTFSFLVCTLFKPNFAFAFLPMLAVLLLIDLIQYRGRYLKNEILLGLAVVPAGLACIWQYLVLFDSDFAGTSSGVALKTYTASALVGVIVMYLRGLLLPIWSFSVQGKKEKGQREHFSLLLTVNAVAILEACLLTETGFRANDGNFDWGSLALYPSLFAVSIALLFSMMRSSDKENRSDRIRLIVGLVLLLGHLLVGVYCLHQPGNAGYDWFYF